MDNESDTSDSYLVIITRKDRVKVFCKIYWRIVLIITFAILFLPLVFIGENNAFLCLYVFLLTVSYWIFDVMHPGAVAIIPIALSTLFGLGTRNIIDKLLIRNGVLDCFGIMITIVAIENSRVHRRVALKLLLMFGCSHYRLSFLLFFTTALLSMLVKSSLACGLMIPIVKAILMELEKMGILDVFHNIGKVRQKYNRHEQSVPRPTDFTIFYHLGIAYSSSIGSLATLIGSDTNELFKYYSELFFPFAPKLEFPHFMLLNLPGVLLMETVLYLWMNFYFMGMFRAQSEIALEIGLTEEEAQYIHTLLSTQYHQLGKIKFHEIIVSVIVGLMMVTQTCWFGNNNHAYVSSPILMCVVLFFVTPTNLDFIKFFKKRSIGQAFPTSPSRACINWSVLRSNVRWSVLFIIAGSCALFDALKTNGTTKEFEKVLLDLKGWPASAQALVVILICKVLTEFGSNACALHVMLPHVARLCINSKIHPHYLMGAATLASSLPFHMATGCAANAMVLDYVHIQPWKMMHVGLGPTLFTIIVMWFTITLWSKAIWPDIYTFPTWAHDDSILLFDELTRRQNGVPDVKGNV